MGLIPRRAPVVGDRRLVGLLLILATGVIGAYLATGIGREGGPRPGDPLGHLLGVAGAALLGIGLAYPLAKRTAALASLRPWWHQGHLLLGAAGAALVALHVAGRLGKAPALVALAVLGLLALGAYGRLLAGRLAHTTFAGDPSAFLPAGGGWVESLRALAGRKGLLVAALEPGASEGIFSLSLRHWALHPVAAVRFTLLALEEERLVGRHRTIPTGWIVRLQRNWRLLHLTLVALMGLGLLAHVVVVLFFAGYVAEGGEPYWWHIRK